MIEYVFNNETLVSSHISNITLFLICFVLFEFARSALIFCYSAINTSKDCENITEISHISIIISLVSAWLLFVITSITINTINVFTGINSYNIFLITLLILSWILFISLRLKKTGDQFRLTILEFLTSVVTIATIAVLAFMPMYLVSDIITNSPDQITSHFHQGIVKKMEHNPSTGGTDIYFTRENDNTTYFVKADKKFKDGQIKFINDDKGIEIAFFCVNNKQDPVVKESDKDKAPLCQFKERKSDQQSRADAASGVLQ